MTPVTSDAVEKEVIKIYKETVDDDRIHKLRRAGIIPHTIIALIDISKHLEKDGLTSLSKKYMELAETYRGILNLWLIGDYTGAIGNARMLAFESEGKPFGIINEQGYSHNLESAEGLKHEARIVYSYLLMDWDEMQFKKKLGGEL